MGLFDCRLHHSVVWLSLLTQRSVSLGFSMRISLQSPVYPQSCATQASLWIPGTWVVVQMQIVTQKVWGGAEILRSHVLFMDCFLENQGKRDHDPGSWFWGHVGDKVWEVSTCSLWRPALHRPTSSPCSPGAAPACSQLRVVPPVCRLLHPLREEASTLLLGVGEGGRSSCLVRGGGGHGLGGVWFLLNALFTIPILLSSLPLLSRGTWFCQCLRIKGTTLRKANRVAGCCWTPIAADVRFSFLGLLHFPSICPFTFQPLLLSLEGFCCCVSSPSLLAPGNGALQSLAVGSFCRGQEERLWWVHHSYLQTLPNSFFTLCFWLLSSESLKI